MMVEQKICSKCKSEKLITDFYKSNLPKHKGYRYECKECTKNNAKDYHKNNPEKVKAKDAKWRINNKEHRKAVKKAWDEKNKEYILAKRKEYYYNNIQAEKTFAKKYRSTEKYKEQKKTSNVKYRQKNLEKLKCYDKARKSTEEFREAKKIYRLKKIESNPELKIIESMRTRVRVVIKKFKTTKVESSLKLFGCEPIFLKNWIEMQFAEGMTWENYGTHWHVDHIIPVSAFNMLDKNHQKMCFHYENLQPLWSIENLIKSNKIEIETINKKQKLKDFYKILNPF
jgi:hypothetical protein